LKLSWMVRGTSEIGNLADLTTAPEMRNREAGLFRLDMFDIYFYHISGNCYFKSSSYRRPIKSLGVRAIIMLPLT
jgi:hypothetical protein